MGSTLRSLIVITAIVSSAPVFAAEEHVGRDAEKGDPRRWDEPADTPQKRHQTAVKEAGAALAEALRDCRAAGTQRKACEDDARRQHREDMARAQRFLSNTPSASGSKQ